LGVARGEGPVDMAAGGEGRGRGRGRGAPTVAVAVCASAVDNAQSAELAAVLGAQLARACALFRVDEVVVVDDCRAPGAAPGSVSRAAAFLARVLQYMETPQYLRRALIPRHPDLRHAGLLPPLNAPHQPLASEWTRFREGVVLEDGEGGAEKRSAGARSLVDVGLDRPAVVPEALRAGIRLTVDMGRENRLKRRRGEGEAEKFYPAQLSNPRAPRDVLGQYWGFTVRLAGTLGDALRGGEHAYDYCLGTSERGEKDRNWAAPGGLPKFEHLLVAFGGPEGLERAVEQDASTSGRRLEEIFDACANTCPRQGCRTIRTEEALLLSLAHLAPAIDAVRDAPQ